MRSSSAWSRPGASISTQRIKNMSVGQRQKLSILLGARPPARPPDSRRARREPRSRSRAATFSSRSSTSPRTATAPSCSRRTSCPTSSGSRTGSGSSRTGACTGSGDFDELKSSVVRVHVRADAAAARATCDCRTRLSVEYADTYMTAVVHGWNDELEQEIAALTRAPLEVEGLNARRHLSRDAPMRAVARLIWIYCAGDAVAARSHCVLGLVLRGDRPHRLSLLCRRGASARACDRAPLWYQAGGASLPVARLDPAVLRERALLPTIVERLALGRTILRAAGRTRARAARARSSPRGLIALLTRRGRNADLLLLSERAQTRAHFFARPGSSRSRTSASCTRRSGSSARRAAIWLLARLVARDRSASSLPLGFIGRPSGLAGRSYGRESSLWARVCRSASSSARACGTRSAAVRHASRGA